MDKVLVKNKWSIKRLLLTILIVIVLLLALYRLLFVDNRSIITINKDDINIASVKKADFKDFITVNGKIEPCKSFFLDAIEGGIVNKIYKESGAILKIGDTIITLNNSNLQLEVMQRETQLYEQINNLRQTRLLLDQNDLSQQAQLAEIDYQLNILQPQYYRMSKLYDQKLISDQEFEGIEEKYQYNIRRKSLTYKSYQNDSVARSFQLRQLEKSEKRMLKSLDAVGKILHNLTLKAQINGQLESPKLEVGQSVTSGQRLGQIDVMEDFIVKVEIDEHYLSRINLGLKGIMSFSSDEYQLEISKIYPAIFDGIFLVDMKFAIDKPNDLRRGQAVRIKLELGSTEKALLLPTGNFYNSTGGNWIFKIKDDGEYAEKHEIRLGRKNENYYEILSGLTEGERIIISEYENFKNFEKIKIKIK
ncbi:efflux RND transporter periplasmic adaptor subunit [Marivirga sp.]|uniref:efflux RND transporter periplasmic adaptor subunit n=1 Tax=Marivirga sp. TaxID=2018662 RepID=UPI003DA78993